MLLGRFEPGRWLTQTGQDEIVLSWRVTLYRNLERFKFSHLMTDAERQDLAELFRTFISRDPRFSTGLYVPFDTLTESEKDFLCEEEYLDRDEPARPRASGVFLPEENLSVVVNAAEHIAFHRHAATLAAGHAAVDAADDRLLAGLEIAFSDKIGFLTSSSRYLSNGLRLSALLHLGGLKRKGRLTEVLQRFRQNNMLVRNYFGESDLLLNELVWLENGPEKYFMTSESETLADFEREVEAVASREREARGQLDPRDLADETGRSLGLLTHAGRLSATEALYNVSALMLGSGALRPRLDLPGLKRLFVTVQPGHLRILHEGLEDERSEAEARADLCRSHLEAAGGPRRKTVRPAAPDRSTGKD